MGDGSGDEALVSSHGSGLAGLHLFSGSLSSIVSLGESFGSNTSSSASGLSSSGGGVSLGMGSSVGLNSGSIDFRGGGSFSGSSSVVALFGALGSTDSLSSSGKDGSLAGCGVLPS